VAGLSGLEQQMFAAHNAQRAAAGLPPLVLDGAVVSVARARATDMASKGYFAHTSPTGQTAFTLLRGAGISYRTAGENIAVNTFPEALSVSTAMSGFMGSPGHRANILNPAFTRVGIGVAKSGSSIYYAVVFVG
jgi:uncharacterized protein YkwD